ETVLHAAVNSGEIEMVQLALERQASIEATQNNLANPLHYACTKGDLDIVKLLLEMRPESGEDVLLMADSNGHSPLHIAAMYNHTKIVTLLVEQGSYLEMKDALGLTPLLLAAMKSLPECVSELIKLGADPKAKDQQDRNIMHLIVITPNVKGRKITSILTEAALIETMINEQDVFGCTPLHYAAQNGLTNTLERMITMGALCTEHNLDRETALHYAVKFEKVETVAALLDTEQGIRAMNASDLQ
ncbi:hypothetical protein Ciccas_009199, partial [Cichlidogyrus casuarinus]